MSVAALFDIHGNLPALEAVIDELRLLQVDEIVVGGDVFPGPMPIEVLTRLSRLDIPVRFIRGNGDRVVLAARSGGDISEVPPAHQDVVRWCASQLSLESERHIRSWPATMTVTMREIGEVLFCHATPRSDLEVFTARTPDPALLPLFAAIDVPLVVCGHTHMQFDRMIGKTRVVNAGSVGMPFGTPAASWLLLGPGVELRRTSYDLRRAAERVRATRYPQAEQFAAQNVLTAPSEADMLDAFSRVEIR